MTAPTKHVLVVEDDAMLQAYLVLQLERKGFGVLTAASGEDMFRVLAEGDVDLILLDLNLPDGDGLSLAKKIREDSDMPIIIVTARQSRDDRMIALGLGVDDYVTKPFDLEELALRIRNLIARANGGANGSDGDGGHAPQSPGSRHPDATGRPPRNRPQTLFPEIRAGDQNQGLARPQPRRWRMFAAASMLTAVAAMGALWLTSYPAAPTRVAQEAGKTPELPGGLTGTKKNQAGSGPVVSGATFASESPAPAKPAPVRPPPRKSFEKSAVPVSTSAAIPEPMAEEVPSRPMAEVLGYGWVLQSQCDPIPQVEWWKYKTHETVAAYVNYRHRGNWLPYLGKWIRRLVKLQDIHNRDSGAVTNSGLVLKGAALEDYIKKTKKRLSVTHCLAGEAKKAAARKTKSSARYRS